MNLDFKLDLPACDEPPFPPPHLDNAQYLEFIEFNQRLMRENGSLERVIANRPRPVEEVFVLD